MQFSIACNRSKDKSYSRSSFNTDHLLAFGWCWQDHPLDRSSVRNDKLGEAVLIQFDNKIEVFIITQILAIMLASNIGLAIILLLK